MSANSSICFLLFVSKDLLLPNGKESKLIFWNSKSEEIFNNEWAKSGREKLFRQNLNHPVKVIINDWTFNVDEYPDITLQITYINAYKKEKIVNRINENPVSINFKVKIISNHNEWQMCSENHNSNTKI